MTAEKTPRQARARGVRQPMVRYWIVLATVMHVLRDRRFQEKVIRIAITAVALAELGRDNQARPIRRAAARYKRLGAGQDLDRARRALEPGKRRRG